MVDQSVHRNHIVDLGLAQVDVSSRILQRGGRRVPLQEQPFKVLELLLARPGELVTREELHRALWPNSVRVDFEHGLNNAMARLREALGDDRAISRFIETVPRRGYRFVHAITGTVNRGSTAGPASQAIASAPRRRIAVLPFIDKSDGEDPAHNGHALLDAIVDDLAHADGLEVVARTSAFDFNGDRTSPGAVAEALAVHNYVDGSIVRDDRGLRLTVRLIDPHAEREVWSQTFELPPIKVLEIGHDIARAVAGALGLTLSARSATTVPHTAHRLFVVAKAHLRGRTRSPNLDIAKNALDQAITIAPGYAAAHAGLAAYHFVFAMARRADADAGERAATVAVEIDPASSDAWQQLANFRFLRARRNGDYVGYVAGHEAMQRAIALDPGNSLAFQDYGRAVLWEDPELAMCMLDRATQLELLCTYPKHLMMILLGCRGDLERARSLLAEARRREPDENLFTMSAGTLETYFGDFERAVPLLLRAEPTVGGAARIQLWSIYASLGDHERALSYVDFGRLPFELPLAAAARRAMAGDFGGAYSALDEARRRLQPREMLDVATAKFALIAREPAQALELLEHRHPDLATGVEPISARNVMPALDLATARARTGQHDMALCNRIAAYLDHPSAPRLPMFHAQRARLHGIQNEPDAACGALERAYDAGLRTLWAIDLRPVSHLYVDPLIADPAFDGVREAARFQHWMKRLTAANARQREALSTTS